LTAACNNRDKSSSIGSCAPQRFHNLAVTYALRESNRARFRGGAEGEESERARYPALSLSFHRAATLIYAACTFTASSIIRLIALAAKRAFHPFTPRSILKGFNRAIVVRF